MRQSQVTQITQWGTEFSQGLKKSFQTIYFSDHIVLCRSACTDMCLLMDALYMPDDILNLQADGGGGLSKSGCPLIFKQHNLVFPFSVG
jgi:hypothetical protein